MTCSPQADNYEVDEDNELHFDDARLLGPDFQLCFNRWREKRPVEGDISELALLTDELSACAFAELHFREAFSRPGIENARTRIIYLRHIRDNWGIDKVDAYFSKNTCVTSCKHASFFAKTKSWPSYIGKLNRLVYERKANVTSHTLQLLRGEWEKLVPLEPDSFQPDGLGGFQFDVHGLLHQINQDLTDIQTAAFGRIQRPTTSCAKNDLRISTVNLYALHLARQQSRCLVLPAGLQLPTALFDSEYASHFQTIIRLVWQRTWFMAIKTGKEVALFDPTGSTAEPKWWKSKILRPKSAPDEYSGFLLLGYLHSLLQNLTLPLSALSQANVQVPLQQDVDKVVLSGSAVSSKQPRSGPYAQSPRTPPNPKEADTFGAANPDNVWPRAHPVPANINLSKTRLSSQEVVETSAPSIQVNGVKVSAREVANIQHADQTNSMPTFAADTSTDNSYDAVMASDTRSVDAMPFNGNDAADPPPELSEVALSLDEIIYCLKADKKFFALATRLYKAHQAGRSQETESIIQSAEDRSSLGSTISADSPNILGTSIFNVDAFDTQPTSDNGSPTLSENTEAAEGGLVQHVDSSEEHQATPCEATRATGDARLSTVDDIEMTEVLAHGAGEVWLDDGVNSEDCGMGGCDIRPAPLSTHDTTARKRRLSGVHLPKSPTGQPVGRDGLQLASAGGASADGVTAISDIDPSTLTFGGTSVGDSPSLRSNLTCLPATVEDYGHADANFPTVENRCIHPTTPKQNSHYVLAEDNAANILSSFRSPIPGEASSHMNSTAITNPTHAPVHPKICKTCGATSPCVNEIDNFWVQALMDSAAIAEPTASKAEDSTDQCTSLPYPVNEAAAVLKYEEARSGIARSGIYQCTYYPKTPYTGWPWSGLHEVLSCDILGPCVQCTPPPGLDMFFVQVLRRASDALKVLQKIEVCFSKQGMSSNWYSKTKRWATVVPWQHDMLLIFAVGHEESAFYSLLDSITSQYC